MKDEGFFLWNAITALARRLCVDPKTLSEEIMNVHKNKEYTELMRSDEVTNKVL